jgi:hypothetical protein
MKNDPQVMDRLVANLLLGNNRNRVLILAVGAFHPHDDRCLVSLGRVEFQVISMTS